MAKEAQAPQLVKIHGGHIIIRTDGKEYNDSLEHYEADNGAPAPGLPRDMIGVTYAPGEWHRLSAGHKQVPQPMPWAEGEQLLGKIDALLAAQTAREAIPGAPPDPDTNAKRLAALEALMARLAQTPEATPEEKDYQDTGRLRAG